MIPQSPMIAVLMLRVLQRRLFWRVYPGAERCLRHFTQARSFLADQGLWPNACLSI